MRPKENSRPYILVSFGLVLAILGTFQVYLSREPIRIERDSAAERMAAEKAGQELYMENCSACHGKNGEGGVGSPINGVISSIRPSMRYLQHSSYRRTGNHHASLEPVFRWTLHGRTSFSDRILHSCLATNSAGDRDAS
jgi:hypothetical protein